MKYVFAGTPDVSAQILQRLIDENLKPALVVTRPDAPVGRKRVLTASPVSQVAENAQIPVLKTAHLNEDVSDQAEFSEFDIGIIVAYGAFVKEPILSAPELGWFNLHFSLLPEYRGAAPIQRALFDGQRSSGNTIFQLDEGMDTGDVAMTREIDFLPEETADQALIRFGELGATDLITFLRQAELLVQSSFETFSLQPQQGAASFASKFHKGEEVLRTDMTGSELFHKYLGLTSEPGAVIELFDQRVKLHDITLVTDERLHDELHQFPAGKTEAFIFNNRAFLRVSDAFVELLQVQPAGKRPMAAPDWLRGILS